LNVTPGRHSTGTVGLLTHTPTVPVLCLPGVTFNVSLRFLASSCLTACDPGTKGHSVSRQKTHTMPGIGRPLPRTTYYDSSADYSVDDSLNRVEYFSNAVMEDQYDAAVRSRGRDDALLRNMDATIESVAERTEETGALQSVRSRRHLLHPSIVSPSLKSLGMYSDLVSLTTDNPTPSLQLDSVYYRPTPQAVYPPHVLSTSGLTASHPPMMPSATSVTYEDPIAEKSSDLKANEGNNDGSDSAKDAGTGGAVNIPAYYACGGDPLNRPVTELRRKIRRMVATGKKNPNYYRMGLDN